MNIAIDLTAVPKNKAGVGRYLINLIRWLQKIDMENKYYLFIQDDDLDGFDIFNANFKIIPVSSRYMRNIFIRLIWEQLILPIKLKKFKIDLLHSPHYTMPYFSSAKSVVTFHDMTYFILPRMHTFLKRWLFKIYIKISARKADTILAVSNSTAEDLIRILKIKDINVFVTPMGIDEGFLNLVELDKNILEAYGINSDYFLYVGTIEPRKNIIRLLKAYSELSYEIRNKYKLVICGQKGWMYKEVFKFIKSNHLEDNVKFTGFVKDEYLPHIYKGAKLFLYVSLYEGFGIPIIEAMASGVPCITSNLSSMKEVAGEACIKVDPYNENEIKNAIIQLLNNNELYEILKRKGLERAQQYTWLECARRTLEAYKKTYNSISH